MSGRDLSSAFNQALSFHRAGRLAEAEALYRQILEAQPQHFDSLHMLGVIFCQRGNYAEAVRQIDAALKINPSAAHAHGNRGNALKELKRFEEALSSYDRVLVLKPDYAEAQYSRGLVLRELKRFDEALLSYNRALALKPDYADAFNNRGNTLQELTRFEEALSSYDRALALKPDYAEAEYNRGLVLQELGRLDEALAGYDRALALKPDYADAFNNRGNVLWELKRFDDALLSYDRALALKPNYAEAHANRGNALKELNRFEEALTSYDRALEVNPDLYLALNGRGNALLDQGQVDEAINCYRRALAIKPDEPGIHSNLIFACNFDAAATMADHQAERARWDGQHARRFAAAIRPHTNDPAPDRRLRIGYVSSHFLRQAATYCCGGVLLGHDPKLFEVVCYSDTLQGDDVTARLRARAAKWHDTAGLSDDALADLIRADSIDILVDLVGHMRGHRLLVFARKPAPVQVTAWGEPTGTGLSAMDYLLADPVLVPVTERGFLVEQVVDLPNFLGYWIPDPLPQPGALPALGRGYVTFGSFNRLAKILNPVLRTWAAILRAVPQAHLVLKDRGLADPNQRARIGAILAEQGITAERVKLLGPTDRAGHFAAYQEIDIALDPFPHGGGMTTLDALWMGVPVVTWSGRTISSRLAAASLTALGLTDFIAPDPETYVELAVAKATDVEALSRLRANLRKRVSDSAFGDCAQYTRAVEAAYREMWQRWCDACESRLRHGEGG